MKKPIFAGFFDGEGCVTIRKNQGKASRTPSYGLEVIVSQKGASTLVYYRELLGIGTIFKSNDKQQSTWRMVASNAREFLELVSPYLRDKKEQAELGLQFLKEHNRSTVAWKGNYIHVSPEN